MHAPRLIADFETRRVESVLGNVDILYYNMFWSPFNIFDNFVYFTGVRRHNGAVWYLFKVKNNSKIEEIKSANAVFKIPSVIVPFLESKLEWVLPVGRGGKRLLDTPTESQSPPGTPSKIHCMHLKILENRIFHPTRVIHLLTFKLFQMLRA